MNRSPFPDELLETIDEFLSDVSKDVEEQSLDSLVESALDHKENLQAFLENFFVQFYETTLGIPPGSIAILHRRLAEYSSKPPEDSPLEMLGVVNASRRILFHWRDVIADDYVESPMQFQDLLLKLMPELFRSLATYLHKVSHKKLAQLVEELLDKWKGVFHD